MTSSCLQLKPGLQIPPTRLSPSMRYPDACSRHRLHHTHNTATEALPRILNGCYVQRGMRVAKLVSMVDLIATMQYVRSSAQVCPFQTLPLTHQMLVLLTRTAARSPFWTRDARLVTAGGGGLTTTAQDCNCAAWPHNGKLLVFLF